MKVGGKLAKSKQMCQWMCLTQYYKVWSLDLCVVCYRLFRKGNKSQKIFLLSGNEKLVLLARQEMPVMMKEKEYIESIHYRILILLQRI